MLLQKVLPPNHVILQYRGNAVLLPDQVSHSSPGVVVLEGAEGQCKMVTLNFPQGSSFVLKKQVLS